MQAIQRPSSGLDHCNIDMQITELKEHGSSNFMKYPQTHEKDESVESLEPPCFRGKVNFIDNGCSESSISSQSPDAMELPYHNECNYLPQKSSNSQDELTQYDFNDIPGINSSFNFDQLNSGIPSDVMFESINDSPLNSLADEQYMALGMYNTNSSADPTSMQNLGDIPCSGMSASCSTNSYNVPKSAPAGSVAPEATVSNPVADSILDDEIWKELNLSDSEQSSAKPKADGDYRRGLGLFLPSPQYLPSSISLDGKIHQHKALSPNPIVPKGPLHLNMYTELPTSPMFAGAMNSSSNPSPSTRGHYDGTPAKGIMPSSSVFTPRMYSSTSFHGGERVSLPYGSSPRGVQDSNQFVSNKSIGEHYTHQVRNRSISKMPLSRMYELMGLSKDHNKAKWREERIISLVKAEGFDVGNQTWIRDTEEATRHRIIESIYNQTRDFGYPPEILEIIVRRGTYARMQSKLRQKRRLSRKSSYFDHEVAC